MSRSSVSQPQRTQNNPLSLGTFSQTSLRYLKGTLGPQWKVVGRADTNQTSNGGFGGGTYNHWFQINITSPAWIILVKGPPRPNYIQVSAYDLNKNPIESRNIFDKASLSTRTNESTYWPYLDAVMGAQSDLYNTFNELRLDKGNEQYFPLETGSYLVCISTTRNERLAYELGIVIEFPDTELLFELEDSDGAVFLQEDAPSSQNTYTSSPTLQYGFIVEINNPDYFNTVHDHSLSEWKNAWQNEHQDTDPFPEIFIPLTNRP
jgi:hypothetical protein